MRPATRDDILQCIRDYPGIHLRGVERTLGLSSALVHYHVKALLKAGAIEAENLHGYVRYFPADPGAVRLSSRDRDLLALLREETPTRIVLTLLDEGPLPHGALVDRLGLAKSTVSYHLDKLVEAGVLGPVEAGPERLHRIRDEARVRRLLLAHRPTPHLQAKFARLWEDFYGR